MISRDERNHGLSDVRAVLHCDGISMSRTDLLLHFISIVNNPKKFKYTKNIKWHKLK